MLALVCNEILKEDSKVSQTQSAFLISTSGFNSWVTGFPTFFSCCLRTSKPILLLENNLKPAIKHWLPPSHQNHSLMLSSTSNSPTLPEPSLVWASEIPKELLTPWIFHIGLGTKRGDFPGGPVTRIPSSQSQGTWLQPGQGNVSHMPPLRIPMPSRLLQLWWLAQPSKWIFLKRRT